MTDHPAPPHPADDLLLALAIDGGAPDPTVAAHAAACPACASRVGAARAVAAALRSAAPGGRTWCPPRELLGEPAPSAGPWAGGVLGRHLAACPFCREDARDLHALLTPAPTLAGALHRLVLAVRAAGARTLELLETTLAPQPAPVLVAIRGEAGAAAEGAVVVSVPFGGGTLEVAASATLGRVDLRARALGEAPGAWRLALSAGDPLELVESRSADERGAVVLGGLEPGRYRLEAFGPQRQAPDLAIDLELRG